MLKDYIFLESTNSLCNSCNNLLEAKLILRENSVYILKYCQKHGEQLELLEEDAKYHLLKREYDKPGNKIIPDTSVKKGCPFDCGLCPSHEQHSCNALIEVTNQCDLQCPLCYASSGKGKHLSLEQIEKMMDFFQKQESGKAEILQISGGEPTTHPEILKIIELAKTKHFRYIMLNTNGLRLAQDEQFVEQLAKFRGRFEIYLQFDGFKELTYEHFRGDNNLLKIKLKAIENLRKYKIPITLVATIEKGINDDELGRIFEFAINTPGIRGLNFQPVAYFGRIKTIKKERITLSGIIKRLKEQTKGVIQDKDIVPLPCNVERVAVSYFYRDKNSFIPLTRNFDVKSYLPLIDNTFGFDAEKILKENIQKKGFFPSCCSPSTLLRELSKLIPKDYQKMSIEERMAWWDVHSFRISISSFVDRFNFDMKSIKKECVHIITPDLKRVPFSTYNTLYRKQDI